MVKKLFALTLFLSLFLTTTVGIKAQSPTTQVDTLIADYTQKLDEYRTQENLYYIATQQYYTLKTLASEEDAVAQTRTVMLARVDAMNSYLTILQTILNTYPGIELTRKTSVNTQITSELQVLKTHRDKVQIATDRITIESLAVEFEGYQPALSLMVYQALSLIKIGGVQASYDELNAIKPQVDAYITNSNFSDTIRLQKQRGSDELGRTLTTIKQSITDAITEYDNNIGHTDVGTLNTIEGKLGPGFSGLNQGSAFVKELIQ